MYDVAFADQPIENFRKWATLRIDALNHALRGLPEERSAITSAGAALTRRTPPTSRCATSSIWCCA
jgi:hypothetical protein